MIRYALVCADAHDFEAWFSSSDAFEEQKKSGHLVCPMCGSASVERALMAPTVSTSRRKQGRRTAPQTPEVAQDTPQPPQGREPRFAANVPPEKQEVVNALRKLREHLTENAENVGKRFAEEARRIHYNEAEKRGIFGEATPEDARALAEEGVEIHPLPPLPEDHN